LNFANKLQFDFESLSQPGFALSGLGEGSGFSQSLQSKAPSISIASAAQTVISSATAFQSDLGSVIPGNCTLGTTSFCLGNVNNITCSRLPLNMSDLLSRALPALGSYKLSGLELLGQELKRFSAGTIEGPFILGIISAVILIPSFHYASWKGGVIWGLPWETAVGSAGSAVCLLSFLCSTIVLSFLYSETKHLPFITVAKGRLWRNSITALCCAGVMVLCVISVFIRKHIL
jgi:hypothetical protein